MNEHQQMSTSPSTDNSKSAKSSLSSASPIIDLNNNVYIDQNEIQDGAMMI